MTETLCSICVVSFNTREMTLACLRSIVAQTAACAYEVIIVDNGSSDGSAEAIAAEFPQFKLLLPGQNLGFARANNLAAQSARGELLLLLNPDTVVLDRAIEKLLEFAARQDGAGIWGGRTVFSDGRLNGASCWGRQTLWSVVCRATGLTGVFRRSSIFNPEALGGWQRDTERAVDIVSGCFFLIRRRLWEQLGGFDPAFFMYGEEADLCLRALRLGATPMVTPSATIVHYGGASERVRSEMLVRLLRAKAQLMRRHWRRPTAFIGIRLLTLWCVTRVLCERTRHWVGASPAAEWEAWASGWRRRKEWMTEPLAELEARGEP